MSKILKIHNKSSKPDNVVAKENEIITKCEAMEKEMPSFLIDFFIFLKNAVAINTRLAYLQDIVFFLNYLCLESPLIQCENIKEIKLENFSKLRARDINRYLGDYCVRYYSKVGDTTYIMENHNRSLSRKRSTLSVLFKFMFRDELMAENISHGFNPIHLPKPQPDAIKKLEINEVAMMLDSVRTGRGLSDKELQYWAKTKLRDTAILLLFTTYGLRLKELQQLNISSFNFGRGEFKIYRKRGKEVNMPLNKSIELAIKEYIQIERCKESELDGENEDALFLSLQKRRMTDKSIRQLVKKYTSIPLGTTRDSGYSPHKLRATAASSLIQHGFSIYDVQNLLDHDNVTTTQLYAAHKKNVKREIVKNYELLDEFDVKKPAKPAGAENEK